MRQDDARDALKGVEPVEVLRWALRGVGDTETALDVLYETKSLLVNILSGPRTESRGGKYGRTWVGEDLRHLGPSRGDALFALHDQFEDLCVDDRIELALHMLGMLGAFIIELNAKMHKVGTRRG